MSEPTSAPPSPAGPPAGDPPADADVQTRAGDDLLAELADDYLRRHRANDRPSVDEYARQHPDLADRIRDVLPAVLAMERPAFDAGGPGMDPSPPADRAGTTIGRYRLLERIGEGGFGVVYMAEQTQPVRRRVALKVVKPGMDSRQVLARFEAERQALAIMDHPNIAKVFDGGLTDAGRSYFVMELVKGEPITDFCDRNQLAPRQRLELFAQVCQAVQHAHQKGVIHRDIKPGNVLVAVHDTAPVVKVIDFGIAKALGQELTDKTLFTGFAQLVGTPLYMSPEQAGQSALDVDTRSDIYSLGVLLYELLTGSTPFDKERFRRAAQDEIRRIIREEEPPRPSTRLSESKDRLPSISAQRHTEPAKLTKLVRGELDWIVMKALEKDRARRYATATGLASDVGRYLRDEPVSACPPSASYRLRKFGRRYRVPLAVAVSFLLLLVAAVVVSTGQAVRIGIEQQNTLAQKAEVDRQRQRAEQERDRAVLAEQNALTEAQKSEQVAAFMKDMLQGVGPYVALGRDTTILRDILERTAQRIGEDLRSQPAVEAELRFVLGRVYRDMGEHAKAEAMHRRAVALYRDRFGSEHARLADCLHALAQALKSQQKLAESERLHREALGIRAKLLGRDDTAVADSLNELGHTLHLQRRNAEAEPLLRDGLEIRRNRLGSGHPDTASSLFDLAVLLRVEGRFGESEELHREALAIRRRNCGDEHPDVAQSINSLANLLRDQGRLPEAEAMHREALAIRRKVYGGDHRYVVQSLEHLAWGLHWGGKLREADDTLGEAVRMRRRLQRGPPLAAAEEDRAVARDKSAFYRQWASDAIRQGKLDFAETAARRAIELHPEYPTAHRYLGLALAQKGLADGAILSLREALRLDPKDAVAWHELGNALLNKGEPKAAKAAFEQALRVQPNYALARKALEGIRDDQQ